jgi:hypothetical protein
MRGAPPEKVLARHLCYQMAEPHWKLGDARLPNDDLIYISKSLTSRRGASARRSRPGRSAGFHAIAATSATKGSKTGDQYDGSRGDGFGCA